MERTGSVPFAPVTAVEHAEACYVGWREDQVAADYMTDDLRLPCGFPRALPGSGACRRHRPAARSSGRRPIRCMHALLHAWHARSGQPALINTSFNRHEEPIVCAPQDAPRRAGGRHGRPGGAGRVPAGLAQGENAFARARFE
ncbi:carbamoyltransferase C-terminal domain-containing protein [Pseudomonas aeruginosa]|nr:carbamoyltransferase C-terminal domain-containing protein [Pseudomonas aeruginosa]